MRIHRNDAWVMQVKAAMTTNHAALINELRQDFPTLAFIEPYKARNGRQFQCGECRSVGDWADAPGVDVRIFKCRRITCGRVWVEVNA